jgi:hypothetical protein
MDEKTVHIHTSCKECLFAEFNGDVQTGCKKGRLEIFEANNLLTTEDNHFRIKAICNTFCKDPVLLPQIDRIIRIKCDLLVYSYDIPQDDSKNIIRTVKDGLQYTEKPNHVLVVIKNNFIKFKELITELKTITGEIPLKVVRIIDNITLAESINRAFPSIQSTYYTVVKAGDKVESEYIERLNTAMNVKLRRFVMVHGSHNIYQTSLHKAFYGFSPDLTLEEKILQANEHQLNAGLIQESMVYTWNQI